jgi:hypothetical protein
MHSVQQYQGGKRLFLLPVVALVGLILALAILAATQPLPSFSIANALRDSAPVVHHNGEYDNGFDNKGCETLFQDRGHQFDNHNEWHPPGQGECAT